MKKLSLILIILLLMVSAMHAQWFNRQEQVFFVPRQMALGGAGTALVDPQAIFFNPGAACLFDNYYFNLAYYSWRIENLNQVLFSTSIPLNHRHMLSLAFSDFGQDKSDFQYSENRFSLAYSNNLIDDLNWGIHLYYFRQNVGYSGIGSMELPSAITGWMVDYDVGILYSPWVGFRSGLSIQNMRGGRMNYNRISDRTSIHSFWTLGFSYQHSRFNWVLDLNDRIQGGVEYTPLPELILRSGLSKDLQSSDRWTLSMGVGIDVSGIQFSYTYLPHYDLPDIHLVALTASVTKQSKALLLRNAFVPSLYTALFQHYANNPPAYVTLQNQTSERIRLKPGLRIPGLMKEASYSSDWVELSPKEIKQISVPLILPPQVVNLSENFNTQAEFRIQFMHSGKEFNLLEKRTVSVYGSRYMTWDNIKKLASFISPADSSVIKFTRQMLRVDLDVPDWDLTNTHFQSAVLIYGGLQLLGLKYIKDPNIPDITPQTDQLDYVQYPAETFRRKTGDCDDMVVLMASCLESVGIGTALISIPNHIMLAFHSGLKVQEMDQLSLKPDEFISYQGELWVPLEITVLEKENFQNAWKKGAQTCNTYKQNPQFEFIPLSDAWKIFPPIGSFINGISFVIDSNLIRNSWLTNIQTVKAGRLDQIESFFKLKGFPDQAQRYNNLGVYYARMGFYDLAQAAFEKSISFNPKFCDPFANLANIHLQRSEYSQAILMGKQAIKLKSGDAELHLNLAIAYLLSGNKTQADFYLKKAITLNPSRKDDYEKHYNSCLP
ncbi:MAG: hypothetical protein KBA26_09670 [Candidatus Delongbacteria bacterium]|nr:hypothetical protein [Candidatus Delongbacteria bacterium]